MYLEVRYVDELLACGILRGESGTARHGLAASWAACVRGKVTGRGGARASERRNKGDL